MVDLAASTALAASNRGLGSDAMSTAATRPGARYNVAVEPRAAPRAALINATVVRRGRKPRTLL
jgi:hypothetical protein